MSRKQLFFYLTIGILVIGAGIGLIIIQSKIRQTESKLGPASETLTAPQKLRLVLQCAKKLEQFDLPYNSQSGKFVLEITEQESVSSVINKIAQGLNSDPELLRLYWVYTGADRMVRPGRYALSGKQSVRQITDAVIAAEKSLVQFAFFSGMRLEEIAELIEQTGFTFSGADFLNAAKHYDPAIHPTGGTSLEGYFVPGTYEMSRSISLDNFLMNFVQVFNRKVKEPYEEIFLSNGLTLREAVILSSMIAREAMSDSEYGLIASVFYNRIASGMKFESDPTAQYAIGWDANSASWWKTPLTLADISINSEYNTYVINGFPPGPICNPDLSIYRAAAFPEQTDYYYFRARCDNTPYHNFSKTYEEHVSNACN